MLVNEFIEGWTPVAEYLDVDMLKTRLSALRGLSNVRPDISLEELYRLAQNVLDVNKAQYESLAQLDPFKTYFEESSGAAHDTNSGRDVKTQTDTRKTQTVSTPGVTETVEYGKTNTYTPTGMRQTDNFVNGYNQPNFTSVPDSRTQESYQQSYKEVNTDGGKDVHKREGSDKIASEVLSGNLEDSVDYGHEIDNTHNDKRSGYVLRDIIELTPKWVVVYDRIVQDVFSVIGSLIATRKIDFSLDW